MDKVDDVSFMKRCFRRVSVWHMVHVSSAAVFLLSCPDWVLTEAVSTGMMCAVWAEAVCWPYSRIRVHLRFIGRCRDTCRDPRKLLSPSFVSRSSFWWSFSHNVLMRWWAVAVMVLSFYRKVPLKLHSSVKWLLCASSSCRRQWEGARSIGH